jgi:hypothetical protein
MQRGLSSVRLRPYRVYREVPVCLGDDWGIVKGNVQARERAPGDGSVRSGRDAEMGRMSMYAYLTGPRERGGAPSVTT